MTYTKKAKKRSQKCIRALSALAHYETVRARVFLPSCEGANNGTEIIDGDDSSLVGSVGDHSV